MRCSRRPASTPNSGTSCPREQVVSQAERRVLRGKSVPASDKILSIFEPHTDIIIKDNREPIYGHKVCLTSGASGLITDVMVLEGNPATRRSRCRRSSDRPQTLAKNDPPVLTRSDPPS
jgi:hypothetical protein